MAERGPSNGLSALLLLPSGCSSNGKIKKNRRSNSKLLVQTKAECAIEGRARRPDPRRVFASQKLAFDAPETYRFQGESRNESLQQTQNSHTKCICVRAWSMVWSRRSSRSAGFCAAPSYLDLP